MKLKEYIKAVSLQIGAHIAKTEMNKIIPDAVEDALRVAKGYMSERRWKTYPFQPVIDTTEDRILKVRKIYWEDGGGSLSGANPNNAEFDIYMGSAWIGGGVGGGVGMNEFARRFSQVSQKQKMLNSLGSDLTFTYNYAEKKLMPISKRPRPNNGKITVEYILDYYSVEEVHSVEWQNLIIRLAVAITKRAGGMIRGAYTQTNALWENNAEQLSEEGNKEYDEVIAEMKAMGQKVFIKGGNQ